MNTVPKLTLTAVLVIAALLAASQARADFAAIAYSKSTGHYGYSYNASTQGAAERRALAECNRPGAEVLVVVSNGYVALARGEDGSYGYAWGTSQDIAEDIALRQCLNAGATRARIVVSVYSGD